jgi:hypothetical protein
MGTEEGESDIGEGFRMGFRRRKKGKRKGATGGT